MEAHDDKPKVLRSTIQVRPPIEWPQLVDADRDVRKFWLDFDDITGLANDGQGMAPREALKVLRSCLKQSYAGIYKVEKDKAQLSGE